MSLSDSMRMEPDPDSEGESIFEVGERFERVDREQDQSVFESSDESEAIEQILRFKKHSKESTQFHPLKSHVEDISKQVVDRRIKEKEMNFESEFNTVKSELQEQISTQEKMDAKILDIEERLDGTESSISDIESDVSDINEKTKSLDSKLKDVRHDLDHNVFKPFAMAGFVIGAILTTTSVINGSITAVPASILAFLGGWAIWRLRNLA